MKNSSSCPVSCPQSRREKPFYESTCSCSKSCMFYGDCCWNARSQNTDSANLDKTCITLNGLGPVLLVSSCPSPSSARSETCYTGLQNTFPVTSKDTGTTYANYHCAFCNKDISSLTGWPVQLRCCEKERPTKKIWLKMLIENFVQHQSKDNNLNDLKDHRYVTNLSCDCKFYAENEDLTFTKSLELRRCVRAEISECGPSWGNETTRNMCATYLDPVRSFNGVYRNEHCAECNGEKNWIRTCSLAPNLRSNEPSSLDVVMELPKPSKKCLKNCCSEGEKWIARKNRCVPYTDR